MHTTLVRRVRIGHLGAVRSALRLVLMATVWGLFIPSSLADVPQSAVALRAEVASAIQHREPSDAELAQMDAALLLRQESARAASLSRSIGRTNAGFLRNGVELTDNAVIRSKLGSETERYGTAELVSLIQRSAEAVAARYPGSVMSLGDLSREGGGYDYPHVSHQAGRDVDIGFYLTDMRGKPVLLPHFVKLNYHGVGRFRGKLYRFDAKRNWVMIRALLTDPQTDVQHIFVANGVRRLLLREAQRTGASRELLHKAELLVRQLTHGAKHHSHFHVRIFCAESDLPQCVDVPPYYPWHSNPQSSLMLHLLDGRPRTSARV